MNLNELKESGLLELYVLGELGQDDILKVEAAIKEFSSLKQEINEIEIALQLYAKANAVPAPPEILSKVLSEIGGSSTISTNPDTASNEVKKDSMWTKLQPVASLLGLIGLSVALYFNTNKLEDQKVKYEAEIEKCEKEKEEQNIQLGLLEGINSEDNQVIFAEATEKYPNTKLYFNHNKDTGKNYIQLDELPGLADNQSYQLWSLKGDNAPVPLDVFQDESGKLIEVSFIADSDAYAITIEPRGGQDAPTMENLVAVIKIT